jgi:peptidoglycan/xylan/chitin deacetylase (PgdA/CDA1 family)
MAEFRNAGPMCRMRGFWSDWPPPNSPAPSATPGVIGETPKPVKTICLTFDDGPQDGTEDVLDVLAGHIPGTFFLTGRNMANNKAKQKALVERILREGHAVGNHTYTHDPQSKKGYLQAYGDLTDPAKLEKFQENLQKDEDYFEELLGRKEKVFQFVRLPGDGRLLRQDVKAAEALGMVHVGWQFEFGTNHSFKHLNVLNWQSLSDVATEFKGFPPHRDIILFHDRHWYGKKETLKGLLKKLEDNGFIFGRLDESGKCH